MVSKRHSIKRQVVGVNYLGRPVNIIVASQTGKPKERGEWIDGHRNGSYRIWNEQGELVVDEQYKNDMSLPKRATVEESSAADVDACVQTWIERYRKLTSPDALVNHDQVEEWEGWCKQGRKPE